MKKISLVVILSLLVIFLIYGIFNWYYSYTKSGILTKHGLNDVSTIAFLEEGPFRFYLYISTHENDGEGQLDLLALERKGEWWRNWREISLVKIPDQHNEAVRMIYHTIEEGMTEAKAVWAGKFVSHSSADFKVSIGDDVAKTPEIIHFLKNNVTYFMMTTANEESDTWRVIWEGERE